MTEQDVLDQLSGIFAEVFEAPGLIARPEMTARDVERWDSLSHIDMIVCVEERFDIRLSAREVVGLKDVGALVGLVLRKAGAA